MRDKAAVLRECLWLLLEAYIFWQVTQSAYTLADANAFARALFQPRRTDSR